MAPQRSRLLALADTEDIEIAVLPERAVLEPSGLWWVPFTVIAPRTGGRYAVVEDTSGERFIRETDELASWTLLWDRLWASATRGEDAIRLIQDMQAESRSG